MRNRPVKQAPGEREASTPEGSPNISVPQEHPARIPCEIGTECRLKATRKPCCDVLALEILGSMCTYKNGRGPLISHKDVLS